MSAIQRKTGVALWRQIADGIRAAIARGEFRSGEMLPPEMELARRFGVNRHTVRSAIAALSQEGLLRAEQGRGTMILRADRLHLPISSRTRFSQGVGSQARSHTASVLGHDLVTPPEKVRRALGLSPQGQAVRVDLVYLADAIPVSRAVNWFDAARFGAMGEACEETGSITRAFARLGVSDYMRLRTEISAAHAQESDLEDLRLSAGAVVITAFSVNIDMAGQPIQAAETRFAADRVVLDIENEQRPLSQDDGLG